jgi:hypothetical protein
LSKEDDAMFRFSAFGALLLYLVAGSAGSAQPIDPVFANGFEAGLIGFGPALNLASLGSIDQPTEGTPLQVTLAGPAAEPTFVAVTSTDTSVVTVAGGGVTVPMGQTSALVLVSGLNLSAAPVTVWATLGNTIGAGVLVYFPTPLCVDGVAGDLPGYTRQCSGTATNFHGTVLWDNTFDTLFAGAWPGSISQVGHPFTVTLNAVQFGSFLLATGTAIAGIHIYPNNSMGSTGLISISTVEQGPGVFPSALCYGSDLSISTRPGTVAQCKLQTNSMYYLNFSLADYFPPYPTSCSKSSCKTGWGFDQFGN